MVIVRVAKPAIITTSDKAMKPVAYGSGPRPPTEPVYPLTLAEVTGRGRYRILIAGDGNSTAKFNVYVDGATTATESAASDVPAIIEGDFNTSVKITIEGSGLHASYAYEVWIEQDYITSVAFAQG